MSVRILLFAALVVLLDVLTLKGIFVLTMLTQTETSFSFSTLRDDLQEERRSVRAQDTETVVCL